MISRLERLVAVWLLSGGFAVMLDAFDFRFLALSIILFVLMGIFGTLGVYEKW